MSILYFIIALGLLIFVHELGHFISAKRAGICVDVFSLGFGPRLAGFKRGDTDYRISLLPFGGYVKMRGDEAGDSKAADPRSLAAQGVWTRVKVVAFGPIMNLVLCIILMPIVFMIGREEPVFLKEAPRLIGVRAGSPAEEAGFKVGDMILSVDGRSVESWEDVLNRILLAPDSSAEIASERDGASVTREVRVAHLPDLRGGYVGFEPMFFLGNEAVIGSVRAGGPAAEIGLMAEDRIISVDGEGVKDWIDLSQKIDAAGGRKVPLIVGRGDLKLSFDVVPEFSEDYGRWLIGIMQNLKGGMPMAVRSFGIIDAIVVGTKENIRLAGLTLDVLGRLVTLKLSYKVLGGPIAIAKTSAAAAASGLADFIYFLAFLSIQLSILNCLPIPVLDGGQLVFLGIEAVRRKPVDARVRSIAEQVGFAMLVSLMLLVTYNDIENVWGIGEILKKIF